MSRLCPRCRRAPPGGATTCAVHGLYALEAEALAHLDEAPLLGNVLDGRYPLVGFVGGGGMGAVYRGLQRPLDRPVAVKVLHSAVTATRSDRERFEREARAMSLLESPHTVTLFDYGVIADGPLANLAYMVMELVQGESLARRLQRGALPPAETADILDEVADSLSEAHARGIVHRDLKPDNILLTTTHDGRRRVKVIDFGIACMEGAAATRTGLLNGTPCYMAPEQCAADPNVPRDGRIDVYAMGVVLFEMLTRTRPFDGIEPLHILVKHMSAAIPRLPGADRTAALAAVEPVVRRALEKDPAERFQTISELSRTFRGAVGRRVEEERPLPPGPEPAPPESAPPPRKPAIPAAGQVPLAPTGPQPAPPPTEPAIPAAGQVPLAPPGPPPAPLPTTPSVRAAGHVPPAPPEPPTPQVRAAGHVPPGPPEPPTPQVRAAGHVPPAPPEPPQTAPWDRAAGLVPPAPPGLDTLHESAGQMATGPTLLASPRRWLRYGAVGAALAGVAVSAWLWLGPGDDASAATDDTPVVAVARPVAPTPLEPPGAGAVAQPLEAGRAVAEPPALEVEVDARGGPVVRAEPPADEPAPARRAEPAAAAPGPRETLPTRVAAPTPAEAPAPARRPRPDPRSEAPPPRTQPSPEPREATPARPPADPPPDPDLAKTAADAEAALHRCRCGDARRLLDELRAMTGGAAHAAALGGKVAACRAPDVDETCVNGAPRPR